MAITQVPSVTFDRGYASLQFQAPLNGTVFPCHVGIGWSIYHCLIGKTLGKFLQLFGCHALSSERVEVREGPRNYTVYMRTDVRNRFINVFQQAVLKGTPNLRPVTAPGMSGQPLSASDIKRLLGGTSDHSWKTYEVQSASDISGAPSIRLKVGTWNLMDKCSGSTAGGAGNNPLKVDEDAPAYQKRKREQILEIERIIQTKGMDACMFQELDFVRSGMFAESLQGKKKQLTEELAMFLSVYREFKAMLDRNGWRMITTVVPPIKGQDFLGIIYNPRTVSTKSQYLTGCFSQDGQFRGATAVFTDLRSQRPIALTDLHLKFGKDPQAQIEGHQEEQIRLGIPEIGLGDFNQTPNKDGLSSAIINWNFPTNVDAFPVAGRGDPKALTTKDGGLNKAYDAALCSPGSPMESMIVTETEMKYFVPNPGVGQGFKLIEIRPGNAHVTLKGRGYMRRKALANKIQQELQREKAKAPSSAQAQNVRKLEQELIALRQ
jgi:hypothetical protein